MAPIPVYTVGIAGGSGAGKSTLARKIFDSLGGATNCTYLFHDSYYKDMSSKSLEERSRINFDHPDSLETELLIHHIRELKKGNIVEVPVYDFTTHTRVCRKKSIELHGPRPILIVEGILILCIPELVKEMDLKVYVVGCVLRLKSFGLMYNFFYPTLLTVPLILNFVFYFTVNACILC